MGIIFTILILVYILFMIEDFYKAFKGKKQDTFLTMLDKAMIIVLLIYVLRTISI